MDKPAANDFAILPVLRDRWSPRSFTDRRVAPETVRSLFEAARWAPSAFNEQPWAFLVGTAEEPEVHAALVGTLAGPNARWAEAAPVLAIAIAKTRFARNDKPNAYATYDLGQAVALLSVQATAMGLALHQMAGFSSDAVRERFAVPDGWEPIAAIAIGHPGEPDALPEELAARELAPRTRKPQAEFVFGARFGQAL